jgi:uncharacterized protein YqgC (DUF456 family)
MVEQALIWLIAAVLVILGMAGLVLPAIPGAAFLFLGLLAGAWAEGFNHVGAGTLTLLAFLAGLTFLVDFLAAAFGAKRFGASSRSIIGATIGAVIGVFFGIPGLLLGPFLGAVAGELLVKPELVPAGRAGIGATVGLALGVAAKLSLGVSMIVIFIFVRAMG